MVAMGMHQVHITFLTQRCRATAGVTYINRTSAGVGNNFHLSHFSIPCTRQLSWPHSSAPGCVQALEALGFSVGRDPVAKQWRLGSLHTGQSPPEPLTSLLSVRQEGASGVGWSRMRDGEERLVITCNVCFRAPFGTSCSTYFEKGQLNLERICSFTIYV